MAMLSGESMPKVLMQVIRFCINTDDHQLKKLMMLYWEVVPKYSPELGQNGKRQLLPEMILVCNALRNDLIHPNEYVRGSMLRFLCKVKDEEILGPLLPSIKACLEHRHPYVRKNAALCMFQVHKLHGENLLPDAPEVMEAFLLSETDSAARRNAFLMMCNQCEDLAVGYLAQHMDSVLTYGDGFQLLVLELCRRVCRKDANQKSRFVRVLFAMLTSDSHAVAYETAWTLLSLSSSPTAIRAACNTYTSLLNNPQCDSNVKLIVLDRLNVLKRKHTKIVQESLMDVLRALSSPSLDVCKKVLEVCMDVVTSRNVADVVNVLKREIGKTTGNNSHEDKGEEYRSLLIKSIHTCANKYPHVAEGAIPSLIDYMSGEGGLQVALFLRNMLECHTDLQQSLTMQILQQLDSISSANVMCIVMWVLGEYTVDADIAEVFSEIMKVIGDGPYTIISQSSEGDKTDVEEAEAPKLVTKNVVLSDGTYATQTAYEPVKTPVDMAEDIAPLRKMIVNGDIFLGGCVCNTLTKLSLRAAKLGLSAATVRDMTIKSTMTMCHMNHMADVTPLPHKASIADISERLQLQCRALLDPKCSEIISDTLLNGKDRFGEFLQSLANRSAKDSAVIEADAIKVQCDDMIHFRQLRNNQSQNLGNSIDLDDGEDLMRATELKAGTGVSELSHVYQLSGLADSVYAEALVTVHDYDIILEILLINRTAETLDELTVELSAMGDMKIVERPNIVTLGPCDQTNLRASIKVSSTETGHIFGTIAYSMNGNKHFIHLNDIHMDIMDYIRPAYCPDDVFRSMWSEFEWENKVAISTSIDDLNVFLNHIVQSTNMRNLTPPITEETSFLAANLYARSVFGEDALVNVSVEKKASDQKLAGYIRIRSKTQGIALSLGDRITSVQRSLPEDLTKSA